jgi:hypothetical protein
MPRSRAGERRALAKPVAPKQDPEFYATAESATALPLAAYSI